MLLFLTPEDQVAGGFAIVGFSQGKFTVAQVEYLVEPGQIDPDHIITAGVFVKRMIHVPNVKKHIEQRTVRKRA